jgi:hypothetical protein
MFVVKDNRKIAEVLYDTHDDRSILKLARREAEFMGSTAILCDARHGPQLQNCRQLSLYGNKIMRLDRFSVLAEWCTSLTELNVSTC